MCIKFFSKRNDGEVYVIPMKDETMLSIGMMSMALGILFGRFAHLEYPGFSISDFLEGALVGLSITMNLLI